MALPALAFLALLFAQDFTCPMDPDIHTKGPGRCPRCGMKLEARIMEPREYPTTFSFHSPHLAIEVTDPTTGKPVREFELVHEKVMHLFVVSADLEYFAHIHPQDGKIDLDLPKPGNYKAVADFYPKGGTPQFIDQFITTPGYDKALSQSLVHLAPDTTPKTGENLKIELTTEPAEPIPGKKTLLFFKVSPPEGLEQYLGAWSHMFFASEDLVDTIHTHPSIADGGQQIQFDVYFPRATTYRVWVQFQRLGVLNTVSFTIPVKPLR